MTVGRHLFGRTEELAELEEALSGAARGAGGVVLIEGEPGIGKTALVRAALSVSTDPGYFVAWGGTDPMDSNRPFGVLLDALKVEESSSDPRRAEITALLSSHRGGGVGIIEEPPTTAFAIGEALLDVVDDLCSGGPVALVLEDLQWVDPASLALLARLGRRAPQMALALVCTSRLRPRRAELAQLVSGLVATGAARRLSLGALGESDVAALVEELVGEPPDSALLSRVAGAGGNPLFITELIAVLRNARAVDGWAGDSPDSLDSPTPSLGLTILSHLSALAPTTQELLGVASVLGTQFGVSELALAAGRPAGALTASLREAIDAGVLGEVGERLAFRHELIRDALYEDLPRPLRAGLHADIGSRMAEAGAPAASVAEHLLRAGDGGSDAASWLHRAATEAAPASPAVSAGLWEQALKLPGTPDTLGREIETGLALALIEVGQVNAAQQRCERLLDAGGLGERTGVVRACLARTLMLQGEIERAGSEADQALADGLSPQEEARFLGWSSLLPFYAGNLQAARAYGRRAETAGRLAADTSAQVQGLVTQSRVAFFMGEYSAAEELARQAGVLADSDGSPEAHRADPYLWLAIPLSQTDRMAEAEAALRRGRRAAAAFGSVTGALLGHLVETNVHFHCGRFADADAELEAAGSLAEETGMAWPATLLEVRGLIALRQAGPERAKAVGRLERPPSSHRSFGRGSLANTWVSYLAATGQRELALSVGWEAWEASEAAGMAGDQSVFGAELAAVAAAVGERSMASAIASALEALANSNPGVASLAGIAGRARGLADQDPDTLLEALRSYRASPRRYEEARTAEEGALLLARDGRRADAERVAAEAVQLYDTLGLQWEGSRARKALRQVGLRFGARGVRSRPSTGWASLTATENRVAALVTEGLSNPVIAERLFLSRRTVESHVSHILRKLELRSRVELAAAGARRRAEDAL